MDVHKKIDKDQTREFILTNYKHPYKMQAHASFIFCSLNKIKTNSYKIYNRNIRLQKLKN